jgi:U3 small nucleolar RNA-associated protein 21
MRVFMQEGGIRSLAFRSGMSRLSTTVSLFEGYDPCFLLRVSLDGTQILSAAASTGHIAFWDLNSGGKLLHVIRGAHEGATTGIEWIPGQPILVSSGEDNSVKVGWCCGLLLPYPHSSGTLDCVG